MKRGLPSVLLALLSASMALPLRGADAAPNPLAFRPGADGGFEFNTGVLRGKLRRGGKALGLSSVVHIPSGLALDRGDKGYGLLSHYRVFSANKRYGAGAWDWPSTARLREDGSVEVNWPAAPDRPFVLRASYRLVAPEAVEVETELRPEQSLERFEVFLASYFSERFTNALVSIRELPDGARQPGLLAAEKRFGDWQMFPRGPEAANIINDGRWEQAPNPVKWTLLPALWRPQAIRRDLQSGLAAVLAAPERDCFAVAMPHQSEGHYSVYLSLFGQDAKAGSPMRARARLTIVAGATERELLDLYPAAFRASR